MVNTKSSEEIVVTSLNKVQTAEVCDATAVEQHY